MRTTRLLPLLLLLGCPQDRTDLEAVEACYALADASCSHAESCGDDKYACMADYIEALPCHEATSLDSPDRLAECLEAKAERACDEPNPAVCKDLIGYEPR